MSTNPDEKGLSEPDDQEDDSSDFPIPEEVLADVPREHRQAIVRAFSSVTRLAAPMVNPILRRVTSEHITRIIDNSEKASVREDEADKSRRRYQFAYFVVGIVAVGSFLVFFVLTDNRDLLPPIVTAVAGFLGGLALGQRLRN